MKKYLLPIISSFIIVGCSLPKQESTVPMDMKTVQEYQQRVASGNTVSDQNYDESDLNHSDKVVKINVYNNYPRVYPSIGYHHGWGRSGMYWGY